MERDEETVLSDAGLMSALDDKKIELQKERQRFFDQRNALSKVIRDRSRQEELNNIILSAINEGSLPALEYMPNPVQCSDNDLLVSLNDIHYGADVDNHWNTYNTDVCRDMMCNYIDKIIAIKNSHGSEGCIVWANGDLISGNIHYSIAVTNKENVIQQITGVSELIAEFLSELSRLVSVAGNHSRIDTKDRALKDERLDNLIEWYLCARMQAFDNVAISACDKIDDTMYALDVRGLTYIGVHGDYEGSPARIQALVSMIGRPVYAVLSGHKHHNKTDTIQGIKTIMAGSFIGMDDYCIKQRIFGRPEQLVCVCDADGVRCSYDISMK
jgi:hypothetical protein